MTTELLKFTYREYLLTLICKARSQYFRLKKELTELDPVLPQGTWLGTYTSNSKASKCEYYRLAPYVYQVLAHKDKILPSARKDGNPVAKHSLGRVSNPRYLKGILALEKMQIFNAKTQTLERVSFHLQELMSIYREAKIKDSWQDARLNLDRDSLEKFLEHEPLDKFL